MNRCYEVALKTELTKILLNILQKSKNDKVPNSLIYSYIFLSKGHPRVNFINKNNDCHRLSK